ncbi:MAG: nitroreductase family protein [Candidatus Aenigmatarchaeota archaeon]
MEFDEVLKKRRMVRRFVDKPVSEEILQKILKNAQRAPSAGFTQMQEFIVVKDKKQKERLAKAALNQKFIAEAPVVIVVVSNIERAYWRYGERAVNFYSITDGAFSTMLILLSCVNYGLGACSVGAFDEEEVSRVLNLPKNVRPIFIIPIGYPAERPERLERIQLEKLIHREKW